MRTVSGMPAAPSTEIVLVHGLHLEEPGWNDIMWGSPATGTCGRVSRGAIHARTYGAVRLLIGSSASRRAGRFDSMYAVDALRTGCGQLAAVFGEPVTATYEWIEEVAEPLMSASSAEEEIAQLFDRCLTMGATPTIVHSPGDLPSSVACALALTRDATYTALRPHVRFVAADVDRQSAQDDDAPKRR